MRNVHHAILRHGQLFPRLGFITIVEKNSGQVGFDLDTSSHQQLLNSMRVSVEVCVAWFNIGKEIENVLLEQEKSPNVVAWISRVTLVEQVHPSSPLGVLSIRERPARPAKGSRYAHRKGRLTLKVTGAPRWRSITRRYVPARPVDRKVMRQALHPSEPSAG